MMTLLVAMAASGLTLQIEAPQSRVLVGEPFKLVVRWKASASSGAAVAIEDADFTAQVLRFRVHDGSTERVYREWPRVHTEGMVYPVELPPSGERSKNLVLFEGSYVSDAAEPSHDLLFPGPGRYRLRLEYLGLRSRAGAAQQPIESNEISVVVDSPRGADVGILAFSRENRLILDGRGTADQQRRMELTIAEHPDSPYVQWARLRSLMHRGAAGAAQDDRIAMKALRRSNEAAYREHVRIFFRALATDIVSYGEWGVYEDDALAQALEFAQMAEDKDLARSTREQLIASHSRSPHVEALLAREEAQGAFTPR